MKIFFALLLAICFFEAHAQYAPQAGLPGSTAMSKSDGAFTGWATGCALQRGLMNIADPSLGYVSAGDNNAAIGAADGAIVSLGDSGIAVLTFADPIYNGPGYDFAVFENGFRNEADSAQAFLELAFVEVSSDGVNYTRFPSASLTPLQAQVWNGAYIDATQINNLAGKYVAGYGTPFDLQELSGTSGLDINHITHVRLIDVVGDIGSHPSYDNDGRIINDPYPTPFPSSGFDLDAVGVIHQSATRVNEPYGNVRFAVYPNPATDNLTICIPGITPAGGHAILTSVTGNVLGQFALPVAENVISMKAYPAGMYYLILYDANGHKWVEKVTKR